MSRRPTMYVPSNFTVEEGAHINLEGCAIIGVENIPLVNNFKHTFKDGDELIDWIIFTEDHPVEFVDKLESYSKMGERLL